MNSNEFKKEISLKLSEYFSLFSENELYYGQDIKNNNKFIQGAINRMVKSKETEEYITSFLDDCIRYHKESYGRLLLTQEEYFKNLTENRTEECIFDDRLTKEENKALCGEDIYDIHEVYDNLEDCIKNIKSNYPNLSDSDLRNKFEEDKEWLVDGVDEYYSFDEYVVFLATGRVAKVEFY